MAYYSCDIILIESIRDAQDRDYRYASVVVEGIYMYENLEHRTDVGNRVGSWSRIKISLVILAFFVVAIVRIRRHDCQQALQ
jgi:hypothetical protein